MISQQTGPLNTRRYPSECETDLAQVRAENNLLREAFARIEAKGWPRYCDDRERCMARAKEYLDAVEEILSRP